MGATLYPALLSRRAIEEVAIPLPKPLITPPLTNMYFILIGGDL